MAMKALWFGVLLLFGCSADPVAQGSSDNKDVTAVIIANVDGCSVYRVQDGGAQTLYFVRCPVGATQTSWETTHMAGKMIVVDHHKTDTVTR